MEISASVLTFLNPHTRFHGQPNFRPVTLGIKKIRGGNYNNDREQRARMLLLGFMHLPSSHRRRRR